MREAVIVSTARTPIGKAYRGAFNNLEAPTLAAHRHPRGGEARQDRPGRGRRRASWARPCSRARGVQRRARNARSPRACRSRPAGMTVDRQCSSGLMAIATAAKQVITDGVADRRRRRPRVDQPGAERAPQRFRAADPTVLKAKPQLLHADARHRGDRRQALQHRARGAGRILAREPAAHRRPGRTSGKFDDEIVPVTAKKAIIDKDTGSRHVRGGDARARTRATVPTRRSKGSRKLKPVREGGSITAGNASQLSDGASRVRAHGREARRADGPRAARHLPRHGGGRLRARRDGHRSGLRGAEAPRSGTA